MTRRARHIPRSTIDGKTKGRRIFLLLVVLLCVFGLVVCGGFRLHNHEERSRLAMDDCGKSLSLLTYQRQTYEVLIGSARVRDAASLTASEVTDPQTVLRLKESLKEFPGKGKGCEAGASPACLKEAAAFNTEISRWYRSHARRIDDEVAAVKKSHQDRVVQDARTDLSRILAEARRIYSSSEGKVADEGTRTILKKRLEEAEKDGASKDSARLRADAADLRKAIEGVSASVQAKNAAEAKARADSRDSSLRDGRGQGDVPGKGSGQGQPHPAPSRPAHPAPSPAPKPDPSPEPEPSPNPSEPGGGDDDDDPWPGHGWPWWPPYPRRPWPPRYPWPHD